MNDAVSAVSILRRRIAGVLFARQWLVYAAFAFLLCGVALLLAKRWNIALPLWPGLLLLLLTTIAAAWRTSRLMPARTATVAMLDAHSHCGGLLMAQYAVDVGDWRASIDAIPRVAWRAKRQAILTTLCAIFLLVAAIVPARARTTKHSLAIDADVEKLESRIELLKEESILPAERAEAMQAALEELKRDAAGDDPAKTWETLDSLDEATTRSADEAAADAVKKAEELTKTEATATALSSGALDPQTLSTAMNDPETQKTIGGRQLSNEQLKELATKAAEAKAKMRGTLTRLDKNGMLDPKRLADFDKASKLGDRRELKKYLKGCKNGGRLDDALDKWVKGPAGIDRGRGDAPMFFGEEAEQNGKFKEEALPPASAEALANSEVLAVSATEPSTQGAARSTAGALNNAQAGGGSALTPVVQPRHRGTVQRFFERTPK